MSRQKHPICFYGDDFTGATAHLAGFHEAGLRSLLFFDTPSERILERHANELDVIGVAGISRSLAPQYMRDEVLPALELFKRLGSRQIQYKVCSTFDSSPKVGSIGLAIELGRQVFGDYAVPVVAGSPDFGRYTLFGNHFARYGANIERLDRHPSMASHPSTPMGEADLRRHLGMQTASPIGLVEITAVHKSADALREAWHREVDQGYGAVVFDTLHNEDLDAISDLLLTEGQMRPVYSIAAQGLAEGLGRQISKCGVVGRDKFVARDVEQMLVLSGSAAQLNASQIRAAMDAGWVCEQIDLLTLLHPEGAAKVTEQLAGRMRNYLSVGASILFYTALGSNDPTVHRTQEYIRNVGLDLDAISRAIGGVFSVLAQTAVRECGLRRIVLAGGDTTSHAMRQSNAYALEMVARARTGGRLCRLLSEDERLNGVEVMLKGGQVGDEATFVQAANANAWES